MKKYRCTACSYVYDPAVGDPDNGVPAGTPFEDISDDWVCPVCGVGKEFFDLWQGEAFSVGDLTVDFSGALAWLFILLIGEQIYKRGNT